MHMWHRWKQQPFKLQFWHKSDDILAADIGAADNIIANIIVNDNTHNIVVNIIINMPLFMTQNDSH